MCIQNLSKTGSAMEIDDIIDLNRHPLGTAEFTDNAQAALDADGVLVLPGFIRPEALAAMQAEARAGEAGAYFCTQSHSVYLGPTVPAFPPDHPANRQSPRPKAVSAMMRWGPPRRSGPSITTQPFAPS